MTFSVNLFRIDNSEAGDWDDIATVLNEYHLRLHHHLVLSHRTTYIRLILLALRDLWQHEIEMSPREKDTAQRDSVRHGVDVIAKTLWPWS